jgi:hypothetical protein
MRKKFGTLAAVFFALVGALFLVRGAFLAGASKLAGEWLFAGSAGVVIFLVNYLRTRHLPVDDAVREMCIKLFFLIAFISIGVVTALKR